MAIIHYEGGLGIFDYDDKEFYFDSEDDCLRYIGKKTDGSKIKIPDGIISCREMFKGCESLKTAPVTPESVKYCYKMFYGCKFLKQPPVISNSVTDCQGMFVRCISLEIPPVIPNSVENCYWMFACCSKEIQKAGKWNIEHRGESYYDYVEHRDKEVFEYFPDKKFDDAQSDILFTLIKRYKESGENSFYGHVIQSVKERDNIICEDLERELKVADDVIERRKNMPRRVKQFAKRDDSDVIEVDGKECTVQY